MAKKTATKKAAAKKTSTALAIKETTTALAEAPDFMTHIGSGLEGTDKDSFAIPFLRVLQKGSPQCEDTNPEYMEEAKPGMFLNSVTGRLFDEVTILPCAFQRRFVRWAPRGDARGFVSEHCVDEVARMQADGLLEEIDGRLYFLKDGKASERHSDRLVDTRNHFVLVITETGVDRALLSLSSTQIKRSKQLMSILSSNKLRRPDGSLITPPTWMNKIRVTTALESNDQGSWYGVLFQADGMIDDKALYNQGYDFHKLVQEGGVQVQRPDDENPNARQEKF